MSKRACARCGETSAPLQPSLIKRKYTCAAGCSEARVPDELKELFRAYYRGPCTPPNAELYEAFENLRDAVGNTIVEIELAQGRAD